MKYFFFVLSITLGLSLSSCSDDDSRDQFLGDWQCVDYSCDGSDPEEYTFTLQAGETSSSVIVFDTNEPEIKLTGTVKDNILTITDSVPEENILVNGTLTIEDDILSMSYDIIEDQDPSYNCIGTATRF